MWMRCSVHVLLSCSSYPSRRKQSRDHSAATSAEKAPSILMYPLRIK